MPWDPASHAHSKQKECHRLIMKKCVITCILPKAIDNLKMQDFF